MFLFPQLSSLSLSFVYPIEEDTSSSKAAAVMAKVELQVNQENSILRDTVHRRVTSVLEGGKGETFSVHFGEFDDYYYGIHSEKKEPLRLTLSMSIPTGGLPTG